MTDTWLAIYKISVYNLKVPTALQTQRSRVRFSMVSLQFFIDILPVALWPWGWLGV